VIIHLGHVDRSDTGDMVWIACGADVLEYERITHKDEKVTCKRCLRFIAAYNRKQAQTAFSQEV
jgi:hypothetical protein